MTSRTTSQARRRWGLAAPWCDGHAFVNVRDHVREAPHVCGVCQQQPGSQQCNGNCCSAGGLAKLQQPECPASQEHVVSCAAVSRGAMATNSGALAAAKSALFQPYRTVGVVAGQVQAQLQGLGTENFLCMPIDRSFHVYDCANLRLAAVSAVHDSAIRCGRAPFNFRFRPRVKLSNPAPQARLCEEGNHHGCDGVRTTARLAACAQGGCASVPRHRRCVKDTGHSARLRSCALTACQPRRRSRAGQCSETSS